MKQFGKIKNGELVIIGSRLVTETSVIFNPTEKLAKEDGWKEVEYLEAPDLKENQHIEQRLDEDDEKIIVSFLAVDDEPQIIAERYRAEADRYRAELKDLDYIGTKIATGRATKEEYADEIARMTEFAEKVNYYEALAKELENE